MKRNPSWRLPRLLLARVLCDYALSSAKPQYANEAMEVHLAEIRRGNPPILLAPFWLAQQLHIYSVGARLSSGERRIRYRKEADCLAELLLTRGHHNYAFGRRERARYFTNVAEMDGGTDFSRAIEEWKTVLQLNPHAGDLLLVGGLFIRVGLLTGNMELADEFHRSRSLPTAAWFRGAREETIAACKNLKPNESLTNRFWANAALFACGHDERREATKYFRTVRSKGDLPPWIDFPLQLFLQETRPMEVVALDTESWKSTKTLHTGIYLVVSGHDNDAIAYFDKVIEANSFMTDVHHWAHAYRLRIEKDPGWYQRINPSSVPK